MLTIKKITFENFGPYYGKNELVFPKEDGVTIIWGNNGFGKTSIMNAFRYGLWGTILGRHRQVLSPHTFVNRLAVPNNGNMMIEISMTYNGQDFIVTRGLKRIGGDGKHAEDYESQFNLKVDTHTLNREDANNFLSEAFPDRISRFYLFDGELLGEYEDLLDENNTAGASLKQSIEDILGIPILENAHTNLTAIQNRFSMDAGNLSKKDQNTKELSESLSKNQERLEQLQNSRKDLLQEQKRTNDLIGEIEVALENNKIFGELAGERKSKKEQISTATDELNNLINKVSPIMEDSWRTVLNHVINDAIGILKDSVEDIEKKEKQSQTLLSLSDYIEAALETTPDECPTCSQHLSKELKAAVLNKFRKDNLTILSAAEKSKLDAATAQLNILESNLVKDEKEKAELLLGQIDNLTLKIDMLKADLDTIEDKIGHLTPTESEEDILALPQRLKKETKKLDEIKKGLEENQEDLDSTNAAIDKITKLIQKNSKNPDVSVALARRDFTLKLCSLFEDSISLFREKMREDVEKDASSLFKKIASDKSYDHLQINDNYGMQICWADGEIVPNRSSGYEQVVAISLVGALHKNAPIEGPIFMDSTFQRVDGEHKDNTIDALPSFGRQVIVLAYDKEMGDKQTVRDRLGSHLLKEIRLNRISTKETHFSV